MTASQLAKQLHGVKAGKRFQCRCPTSLHAHADRNRSLSVWDSKDWVRLKCFTGCSRDEILAALGLSIRDLALNEFRSNPEWRKRREDEERLETLERRHGIFIMLQNVDIGKRNYWSSAERKTDIEIKELRYSLFPDDCKRIALAETVQRIISEYGFDELMECVNR
jgi:hypothetical protein